jgi:tetratricopeptide (TPR) repeat protein
MGSSEGEDSPIDALLHAPEGGDPIEERQALANVEARLFGRQQAQLRIGRYEVGERLGAGGVGAVYRGRDVELDRRVAIKFVHAEPPNDGTDAQARLLREAKTLAQLSHPNVVRVYDAGTYDGSLVDWSVRERTPASVFMAMEVVEGTDLARWLESGRTWEAILQTFVGAGRGLAAAHERGVVHRDFKPENVMVDDAGLAKVVDFGLASRLVGRTDPPSEADVATGGTPAYMSPEQHEGRESAAASDQFSFCVALYEALFRSRPFQGSTYPEIRDAVLNQPAASPPTDARIPVGIGRALMRGLARDPENRFASMQALLAALERAAGARRRAITAVGAVVLVVTGVGLAALLRPERGPDCSSAAQRLEGSWNDERAARVEGAFAATEVPFAADTSTRVREVLDEYAQAWVSMHTETCEATHVHETQSTQVLDLRMGCLERHRQELRALVDVFGDADRRVVTNAVQSARGLPALDRCADIDALQRALPPPSDPNLAAAVEAERTRLAKVRSQRAAGQFEAALALAAQVAEVASRLDYAPLIAEAAYEHGLLLERSGEFAKAEETLDFAEQTATAARHDELAAQAAVHQVFVVASRRAKLEEGLVWARHAEAALQRIGEPPGLAGQLENVKGNVLLRQGRFEQAAEHYQRAIELRRQAFGDDHPSIAITLNNLANARLRQGKFEEAREYHERAVSLLENALGPTHPGVGHVLGNLGSTYLGKGDYANAADRYQRSLAIRERVLPPGHADIAMTINNLGHVAELRGEYDKALELHERALSLYEIALDRDHPDIADATRGLGRVETRTGQLEAARGHLTRTLALVETAFGAQHVDTAKARQDLAELCRREGDRECSAREQDAVLAVLYGIQDRTPRLLIPALTGRADDELAAGHAASAHKNASEAVRIAEELELRAVEVADARFMRARAAWALGKRDEARRDAQDCAEYFATIGNDPKRTQTEAWLAAR